MSRVRKAERCTTSQNSLNYLCSTYFSDWTASLCFWQIFQVTSTHLLAFCIVEMPLLVLYPSIFIPGQGCHPAGSLAAKPVFLSMRLLPVWKIYRLVISAVQQGGHSVSSPEVDFPPCLHLFTTSPLCHIVVCQAVRLESTLLLKGVTSSSPANHLLLSRVNNRLVQSVEIQIWKLGKPELKI